jgi:hypothetical protein
MAPSRPRVYSRRMRWKSKVFAGATRAADPLGWPIGCMETLRNDCRLARTARVNLLVTHTEGLLQNLLEWLMPDLEKPLVTWRSGERLVLPPDAPPAAWPRTMILQDVGALTLKDQRRLLDWLEQAAGHTQVVSTTPGPLWPRVEAGAFNDTLYYRLNTVCMDATAYPVDAPGASVPGRTLSYFGATRIAGLTRPLARR